MKTHLKAALIGALSLGMLTVPSVSFAEEPIDDAPFTEESRPFAEFGAGAFAYHNPKYDLRRLDTYVDGKRQYVDRSAAHRKYQQLFPDDAAFAQQLCNIHEQLTLDTAHQYHECVLKKIIYDEVEFTPQLDRLKVHVAFLDSTKNDVLERELRQFDAYPSADNFYNIGAPGTEHNHWVFGDVDEPSLFERSDFPGKVTDRFDPVMGLRSFRPTILPEGGNYDAAISYARRHATKYNRAYKSFTGNGQGDCANFVSQILVAGGKKFTGPWRPYTDQWVNADKLQNAMYATRAYRTFRQGAAAATIGDVFFIDFEDDDDYDHVGFIVGKNGNNLEIAQHTKNYVAWTNTRRAQGWKAGMRWMVGIWK